MPANLIRDSYGSLIRTRRLGADWKINHLAEKGRFIGVLLRPGIRPDLDENDTDGTLLPRLLTIGPLIIEANDHTRFRCRQLLARAIT